ncbi:MAG TPA: acyltransferase, partial [Jatrophihabitans sp.]|nr:acyltransferase [Jatrophihabitans sp.]
MAAHAVESSSPASTAGATAKPRPRRRRPDIEGLRAVAVLLVIADHLASEPAGGFIGVDVFFVISGFLITGLLVREARATGRISLLNFYGRRFRRIVPAAVLVLAVTAYAAHLIFIAARADKVRTDALFAAVFGANWHFAATGTDYFQQGVTVSPLQHYWSLSVEEQFYVLWPWVVLLLVLAERRLARRVGPALTLGVTMALTAVSFEWAVHESGRSPVAAYFSSFDRAWELGVGACLAVLSAALNRLPAWLRPPLAYSGLAAIAVAAVTITSTSTFSPPWAAVAVGGAALVIMAGSGAQSYRYLWVLTNPLATWIGALSYSLYLWHYPVIIFAQTLVARRDAGFYLGVCAVTVALSVVSYYVIENPIRRSSLFAPRSQRPAHVLRMSSGRARRADRSARLRAGVVAAAVAMVAAVLTVSAAREGASRRPIAF